MNRINKIVSRKCEIFRVTLKMRQVFHENKKNFNSNKCNTMYLRTKKMYLDGYKKGENKIYQSGLQRKLINVSIRLLRQE